MITEWQIERNGDDMLLGLSVGCAVLDIATHPGLLSACLAVLEAPHTGHVDARMGQFAGFPVTLNLHHDNTVSIFVDGPDFSSVRNQSAAIWVEKNQLEEILKAALRGEGRSKQ